MLNAKNGNIKIGNSDMDYIIFGNGSRILIMLPGVGDGLKTVKGLALPMAFSFRALASGFTVYVFSRINNLPNGYSTQQMAADQAEAMSALDIEQASIVGISQGGMIAQWLTIDFPEMVDRLVLTVSLKRCNDTLKDVIDSWIAMAQSGDYRGIFVDSSEKSYSESYLKKMRPLYPVMSRLSKPKDFRRFLVQAQSCLSHNSSEELYKIQCPTLVIGGDSDQIVGGESSCELAADISNSQLHIYEGLGHGLYDEAKDFIPRVMGFLT